MSTGGEAPTRVRSHPVSALVHDAAHAKQSLAGKPSVVVVGNFDGVHRGHAEVVRRAREAAGDHPLVVLTFEPHPAALFGGSPPPRLTRLTRKVELLGVLGVDLVVAQRFNHAFAALQPAEFVEMVLVEALAARTVVVGFDFRFGAKRAGDLALLRADGRFSVEVQEAIGGERPYSSTWAREALAAGDLAAVDGVLGRPHSIEGVVVEGDRRGRTIGFPTANIGHIEEALPANGVYAVRADRAGQPFADGVANVGVRPTVDDGGHRSVEVHLFDLDEADRDLYGTTLRVHFVARLRDERRFSGLDALKAQIALDGAAARAALSGR